MDTKYELICPRCKRIFYVLPSKMTKITKECIHCKNPLMNQWSCIMEEEFKKMLLETRLCNECLESKLWDFQVKYGLTSSELLDLQKKVDKENQ